MRGHVFVKWLSKNMVKYDTNHDGSLTTEELRFACDDFEEAKRLFGDMFEKIDINGDGKLTRKEWIKLFGNDEGFDAADKDASGYVDKEEFSVRPC